MIKFIGSITYRFLIIGNSEDCTIFAVLFSESFLASVRHATPSMEKRDNEQLEHVIINDVTRKRT